jgi:hypothetical protein
LGLENLRDFIPSNISRKHVFIYRHAENYNFKYHDGDPIYGTNNECLEADLGNTPVVGITGIE